MNKVTVRQIPERLMPDERNQFVQTDIQGEEWADYDSWGIEQACKLITLGYPVHLEGMAEEVKGWPLDCEGRDRFNTMTLVYGRALRIAKSSVQAGTIKEHDTPANWIKWAEGKGYSVAHLMPADAPAAKVKADTSPSGEGREVQAKETPRTNKKTWDDDKLLALWNESLQPGATQDSLAQKHGVSRQRISTLLEQAKVKLNKTHATENWLLTQQKRTVTFEK